MTVHATPLALLAALTRRGVHITSEADGTGFRCRGPAGSVSPSDLATLRQCKADILATLRSRAERIASHPPEVTAAIANMREVFCDWVDLGPQPAPGKTKP